MDNAFQALAFALVVAFLVTLPIYDPNPNHRRHSFVDHLPLSAGYQRATLLINVSPTFLHLFSSSRQHLLWSVRTTHAVMPLND